MGKCVFQHCRSKINVTGAILGKTCHGSSAIFELILIKLGEVILTNTQNVWFIEKTVQKYPLFMLYTGPYQVSL